MELKTLLQFDSIVIQCHNDPDADAIASGFGVWSYLRANKKSPGWSMAEDIRSGKAIWCGWWSVLRSRWNTSMRWKKSRSFF